jgi:formylglycine-generating enzyme
LNGTILRRLFGSLAVLAFLAASARGVTIATVRVGSPGNAPDPANGGFLGAVAYNYEIGTYDVTNAQYAEFLNAKASSADPYGLWDLDMDYPPLTAISRIGSGPYNYIVNTGFANKPVVGTSWYDAVRFVNWLQNGQGNADTESGTYSITGGGNNSGTVLTPSATQRAVWAATNSFHWLLPSENEWYKAAYYNPLGRMYYDYPFQSNLQPAALLPPGNDNSGNFGVFQTTDVGAYPNSISPFGSFDMGGDVFQWNDTIVGPGPAPGARGGAWSGSGAFHSAASYRGSGDPTDQENILGFRVASVGGLPEPASIVLALLGVVGVLIFNMRIRGPYYCIARQHRVGGNSRRAAPDHSR